MHPQARLSRIIDIHELPGAYKGHPGEPYLPLSWCVQEELQHPLIQKVPLAFSKTDWLAFGDVPQHFTPEKLALWLHQHQKARSYMMRGCHPFFLQHLEKQGGQTVLTGREALLDLRQPHLERKSLRELARRGRRHGEIIEVNRKDLHGHLNMIEPFLKRVQANYTAPLAYLYRTQLPASERFWILKSDRIWGLISLIPTSSNTWHTELLLRDPEAPIGILEALIQDIFKVLQSENARYWSLGEIPFHPPIPPKGLKSLAINQIGRKIDFAYSSSGLLNFKKKFRPFWRPVYLYGWPRLSWFNLGAMFWQSNCHQMVLTELFRNPKRSP